MLDTEQHYSESKRHTLSLIFYVENFKHYLIGQCFVRISNIGFQAIALIHFGICDESESLKFHDALGPLSFWFQNLAGLENGAP